MSNFIITPDAQRDLEEIWNSFAIGWNSPTAADRIRDEIFEALKKIADSPDSGCWRDGLATGPLRFSFVRNYLAIYRSKNRPIKIVRILNDSREVHLVILGMICSKAARRLDEKKEKPA